MIRIITETGEEIKKYAPTEAAIKTRSGRVSRP